MASPFLKNLCATTHKGKIIAMCEKMQACPWEREILVEWLCEPKEKTAETLEHSNKGNVYRRMHELEVRVISFIFDNGDFFSKEYLQAMFVTRLNEK